MLSSLSSFSPALFKSNSNYLLRLFSTNAQPRIDPKLKENQSKAWDKTFDLIVKVERFLGDVERFLRGKSIID